MTHHQHFANLSEDDLKKVKDLERELGTVLIAYDKTEVMKTASEPMKERSS